MIRPASLAAFLGDLARFAAVLTVAAVIGDYKAENDLLRHDLAELAGVETVGDAIWAGGWDA